jgi:hypothetical protein
MALLHTQHRFEGGLSAPMEVVVYGREVVHTVGEEQMQRAGVHTVGIGMIAREGRVMGSERNSMKMVVGKGRHLEQGFAMELAYMVAEKRSAMDCMLWGQEWGTMMGQSDLDQKNEKQEAQIQAELVRA